MSAIRSPRRKRQALMSSVMSGAAAKKLFGNGEEGVLLPIKPEHLYTDSAATTLVSAPGDPVGAVTDQSGNGNTAVQATSADRMIYGRQPVTGVRNLLLNTDTLATQDVTVTAEQHTISFRGTGSITLSGTGSGTLNGTGADDVVTLTFTPTAGTLTVTVSGTVEEGQLETGASRTNYQSVGNQYDVTEQGVRTVHYITPETGQSLDVPLTSFTGGTVALGMEDGVYFDESYDFSAGTFVLGDTEYTGGPSGIITTLGSKIFGFAVINRALTEAEKTRTAQYFGALGAGPELEELP